MKNILGNNVVYNGTPLILLRASSQQIYHSGFRRNHIFLPIIDELQTHSYASISPNHLTRECRARPAWGQKEPDDVDQLRVDDPKRILATPAPDISGSGLKWAHCRIADLESNNLNPEMAIFTIKQDFHDFPSSALNDGEIVFYEDKANSLIYRGLPFLSVLIKGNHSIYFLRWTS